MEIGKFKDNLLVTKDNILKYVSEEDIILKYLPNKFKFNTIFSSPFREDKRPSFGIIKKNNIIKFHDFTTGETGNVFEFVMKLHNCTFKEALYIIVKDFNIDNYFALTKAPKKIIDSKIATYENAKFTNNNEYVDIKIVIKKWEKSEIDYWNQLNLPIEYVQNQGKIVPISGYYLNDTYYITTDLAFAYCEKKDDKWTYKIYRPYNKKKKWISNNDISVIELWDKLPENGDYLCITSSRKDALCISYNTNIPSISLQSESTYIKKHIFNLLLNRFKYIFLLFDNDYNSSSNWGQINALKFIHNNKNLGNSKIINIKIPDEYLSKDPSDLFINIGVEKAKLVLIELFNNEIKKLNLD